MKTRIIFDLDGTLIDSAKSLAYIANLILYELNRSPVHEKTYRTFIGDGLKKQVERLLVWSGGIPEKGLDYYYEKFLKIYQKDPISNVAILPYADEAIKFLYEKGMKLGLCTQKLELPSRKIIENFKIFDFFDSFAFGDTLEVKKPDPSMVHHLTKKDEMGIRTFYIGDSEVDAKTASNAKIPFILFSGGYRKCSIEELRPDFCFSDYRELPKKLLSRLGCVE